MFGGQREANEKTVYATADASTYLRTASQAVDVLLSDFLVTLVFVDKGARFGFRNVLPLVIIFLDEPSCNSVEDKDESELVFRHGLCMDREVNRTMRGAWGTGTMDIDVPQPVAHLSGVYPIQRFMVKGLLDAVPGLSWCGEFRLSIVFGFTMEGVPTSSDG